MAYLHYNPAVQGVLAEFRQILACLDDSAIIDRLQAYRPTGRPGWPLRTMWNAYLASFFLDLPHTNALIRRLKDDPALRGVCGFREGDPLPHRTTYNRFISRLANHSDLVEACLNQLTSELKDLLPGFGDEVAIDSTSVRTHSNPNKKSKLSGEVTDPEAAWGYKTDARSRKKDGKELAFGYKVHMIADATHDLPITMKVMAANHNDSPQLPSLMDKAYDNFSWFSPSVATADRGYDAKSNFEYLYLKRGIDPVIHIRKTNSHDGLYDGIYTMDAAPTCMGLEPMQFIGETWEGHYIFRCQGEGCHLKESTQGGTRKCDTVVVENPLDNLRVFGGKTRRNTPEWKTLYSRRQSIERIFKSQKESRRLESHCVRGLKKITLHCLMSTMVYQATALAKVQAGDTANKNWMVQKVA
ncbi:MAG: transposase [Chloroflexi bacterium]|nr:transposase [Chloroflexota bacterium]